MKALKKPVKIVVLLMDVVNSFMFFVSAVTGLGFALFNVLLKKSIIYGQRMRELTKSLQEWCDE